MRCLGFRCRFGTGCVSGTGTVRDIGVGGFSVRGGNKNGRGGFCICIKNKYKYSKATNAQRSKPLMPPIEDRSLVSAVEVVVMTLAVAFPMDPTTFSSRSPTPASVSRMPAPIDRIISLPPLATADIVVPRILPMPEIMSPFPSERNCPKSSRLSLLRDRRASKESREGVFSS